MKQASISLFTFLFILTMHAQVPWQEVMLDGNHTLKDVESAFESQTSGRSYHKGLGWKQYTRWKNFWEGRLMSDGTFPDMRSVYKSNWNNQVNRTNETGNWICIGPVAHETTSSWSHGTGRVNVVKRDPSNENIIYIGAPAGGVWKSLDAGMTWEPICDQLSSIGISDIALNPNNPNIIYLATGDRDGGNTYSIGIVKSVDGGASWQMIGPDMGKTNNILIDPNNTETLWVAASDGLFRSMDGGDTWEQRIAMNISAMVFKPNSSMAFYFVADNKLYVTEDGGDNFQLSSGLPDNSGRIVIGTTPADINRVYVMAANSTYGYQGIYVSHDSGLTFTLTGNNMAVFDNSNQAWYDMAIAVSDVDPDVVTAGVINIHRSTNGGSSFVKMNNWMDASSPSYTHADIHFLEYDNGVLFCGSDGGVFRSNDDAQSFEDLSDGLAIGQFYSIATTEEDNTIVGGLQDNGSYALKNDVWKNYIGADGMESAIDPMNADHIFGMVQYGDLYESLDGGESIVARGRPSGVEDGRWVVPMVMDPQGGRLLVGYDQLYQYDFVLGWEKLSDYVFPDLINKVCVFPGVSQTIVVSTGHEIFQTTDNGISWQNITGDLDGYISSIDLHDEDSNTIWVTLSNWSAGEKVFMTTDNGLSWVNISGDLPNQPINTIKYDVVSHGLYIGTDNAVYYAAANSSQWIKFTDGLPNVIIKDIEINNQEEIILVATFGRGIWQSELYGVDVKQTDLELMTISSPAGMICGDKTMLVAKIKNKGTDDVTSFTVHYATSGSVQKTYDWQGILSTGEVVQIEVMDVSIPANSNEMLVGIASVNSMEDENSMNDQQTVSYAVNPEGIEYRFSLLTDCYAGEVSWRLLDSETEIVDQALANSLINTHDYEYELCLNSGCYQFIIEDAYGDGMAGSQQSCEADGNYALTNNDGEVFSMETADFGSSVSYDFCVEESVVGILSHVQTEEGFYLTPNPVYGSKVTVRKEGVDWVQPIHDIVVMDMLGRVVLRQNVDSAMSPSGVDLLLPDYLSNGLYLVQLQFNSEALTQKMWLER